MELDPADAPEKPDRRVPYQTRPAGSDDSGNFAMAMTKCQTLADLPRLQRSGMPRALPPAYCAAVALSLHRQLPASLRSAWIALRPEWRTTIVAGTLSHGRDTRTSYAQMVSDWLGVPADKIRLAQADTDEVAIGRGTYASRS